MQIHLIAPPEFIPLIAARLLFKPPSSNYHLHPRNLPWVKPPPDALLVAIQWDNAEQICELTQSNPHLIDVVIAPSPLASTYGFITLASGSLENLLLASNLLDCLAPAKDAWLHLGQLGACGFLNQLWRALLSTHGTHPFLDWQHQVAPSQFSHPLNHADLVAQLASLMAQQQLQTQTLACLSRQYLSQPQASDFTPHHPQTLNFFGTLGDTNSTQSSPIQQLAQVLAQF